MTCAALLGACDPGASAAGDDDTVVLPDASAGCPDPTTALPEGWKPVDKVASGTVTGSGSGVITTSIDATAGGFGASAGEPFVYVKINGTSMQKVDIADPASFTSSDWDLAFKRYVIRANGGDSGPGGVTVAQVDGVSLAAVTSPPSPGQFLADDFANEICMPILDLVGGPSTAIGTWYSADGMVLNPLERVYVVRLADGSHIKLRVVTYYGDPADPSRSAYFKIEWAPL